MAETKGPHARVQDAVRNFLKNLPRGCEDHHGSNRRLKQPRKKCQATWNDWSQGLPSEQHVIKLKQRFTLPSNDNEKTVTDALDALEESRRVFDAFDRYLEDALTQENMPQENAVYFLRFHLLVVMNFLRARCQKRLGIRRRERRNPFRDEFYNKLLSKIREGVRQFYQKSGSSAELANDIDIDRLLDAADFGCKLLTNLERLFGGRINEIPFNNKTFLTLLQKCSYEGAKEYIISELKRELMQRSDEAESHWRSWDSGIISPVNMIIANLSYQLNRIEVAELLEISVPVPVADVSAPILLPVSTFDA
ncbi:hypothetical protein H634G_11027 [Metarhizium anisopliae BRIP 53293]|uniref:Uncharacterized protein n=1 Tax=Metarhizium anisopliae BRIP 53293 TaxID=1291518 RepID=A0A0D9NJ01_METAN|nr:hypothetical protein H634G_11027 [Metarhizium anisopliae BRIP 53293]KJK85201.1 hypothetical protein H633G_10965 [Metarhizium anisopliae BRIP 53284]